MRGERHHRVAPIGQHVEAMRLHFHTFDAAAGAGGQIAQMLCKIRPDARLVWRDRIDIDKARVSSKTFIALPFAGVETKR